MTPGPDSTAHAAADNNNAGRPRSATTILRQLAYEYPKEDIPLGEILSFLGDRAFGLLMLVMALPMATPLSAIPGVSIVFGLPLVIVSVQLMLGFRQPVLPKALAQRTIKRQALAQAVQRAMPWLMKIERAIHPRLKPLTGPVAERAIGLVCVVMAGLLALPIPGANQPPALAIALFAIAIVERDGLFTILGGIVVILAIVLLAVIYGLVAAAGVFMFNKITG
jgi:hypothetical protein